MPDLLLIVLIAVLLVVAGSIIAFLMRRRRAAAAAAAVAASTVVPELTEDDISWRIGVSGDERLGVPLLGPDPATASEARRAATLDRDRAPRDPARVPVTPLTPVVVEGARAGSGPEVPVPVRRRLWRDAATILLVACLGLLATTALIPGGVENPVAGGTEEEIGAPSDEERASASGSPASREAPQGTLVPVVAPPLTTPGAPAFTPAPPLTPRATSAPPRRTTAPTTPRPTRTPKPTPSPSPPPTPPAPTPPTPDPSPPAPPDPSEPPPS